MRLSASAVTFIRWPMGLCLTHGGRSYVKVPPGRLRAGVNGRVSQRFHGKTNTAVTPNTEYSPFMNHGTSLAAWQPHPDVVGAG